MNIQEAKEEIANTYRAYMKKNEDGSRRIPPEKQRPVLLIGPPGIGKTAIMKQIAEENGCGILAYSMTHHTRQSAIGLPFISQKEYNGKTWPVTEYTMSEIVASVYDYMEKSGKKSGILFLDEINCVSETLTPVILQLLQNKSFGNVPLPEDWIIVTAGNPPEYNKSVRDFDMVTLDRVKRIDVEANLEVWKKYAVERGIHPAVMTYLSVYPDHFYRISDTDRGQFFVTARGWEDLSLMIYSYEEDGIKVGGDWFLQYLQDDDVARSFGFYYGLFSHFSEKYGKYDESFDIAEALLADPEKLQSFSSTECLAVSAMLFHSLQAAASVTYEEKRRLEKRKELTGKRPRDEAFSDDESVRAFFDKKRAELQGKIAHETIKPADELREKAALLEMEKDFTAWQMLPSDKKTGISGYEKEKIAKAEAKLEEETLRLDNTVKKYLSVIKACPQGKSALYYFISDMSASEAISGLVETE